MQGLPGYVTDRTTRAVDLDPRLADRPGSIPPQMGPVLSAPSSQCRELLNQIVYIHHYFQSREVNIYALIAW